MRYAIALIVAITLILFLVFGCRAGLYVAIGPQRTDEVTLSIKSQEADPNMVDVGRGVGAAIEEIIK